MSIVATQIGFLGNAILTRPAGLAGTLVQFGNRIPVVSLQAAKPALAALLDALEDRDEPAGQLRASFTALQLLNGGLTHLDLSPIARGLSQIPASSYNKAADAAAHSINAAVQLFSRQAPPDSAGTLLQMKNRMEDLRRLLHPALTTSEIPFVMRSLISRLEEGRNFFEQLFAGAREEPSVEILKQYLSEWMAGLNSFREYGLKYYPVQTKKILWEQIRLMGCVVPFEILEGIVLQNRGVGGIG